MHKHVAELAVTLIRNREIYRQVCLMYIVNTWKLVSLERRDGVLEGRHVTIQEHELSGVLERLDELAADWRCEGKVTKYVRRPAEVMPN